MCIVDRESYCQYVLVSGCAFFPLSLSLSFFSYALIEFPIRIWPYSVGSVPHISHSDERGCKQWMQATQMQHIATTDIIHRRKYYAVATSRALFPIPSRSKLKAKAFNRNYYFFNNYIELTRFTLCYCCYCCLLFAYSTQFFLLLPV